MTNQIKANQIKLENVRVAYSNIDKVDNFGKYGLTIQGNSATQFDQFTTTKDGVLPTVRCAGRPNPKNVIGEIEQGDLVNVFVQIEHYEDNVYPRLLAVRLVEKDNRTTELEQDFTSFV